MGCSASRPHLTTTIEEQPSNPNPNFRTLSLPNLLIHHPPIHKGDTNHLVSLTSTTYGSLVLIDNPNPNPNLSSSPKDHSSQDSVINTWELMEGLDDFDFDVIQHPFGSYELVEHADSKPLWKHLSEESMLSKMDPNVVSSYRKALSSKTLGCKEIGTECKEVKKSNTENSVVPSGKSCLSPKISTQNSLIPSGKICLFGTEDKIVLFYTSLRGIRKTYEECCEVRMILKGFRVCVDERDISMDSAYREELQGVFGKKSFVLPQVFVRGRNVGGANEIKQLHEVGELGKILEGFPMRDPGLVCDSCGDARFLPCPNCSGSRKVFEEKEGKLRRCPNCNENGLIRCPTCCN